MYSRRPEGRAEAWKGSSPDALTSENFSGGKNWALVVIYFCVREHTCSGPEFVVPPFLDIADGLAGFNRG